MTFEALMVAELHSGWATRETFRYSITGCTSVTRQTAPGLEIKQIETILNMIEMSFRDAVRLTAAESEERDSVARVGL